MRVLLLWLAVVVYLVIGYWIAAKQTFTSPAQFGTWVQGSAFAFLLVVFVRRALRSRPRPPPPVSFEHPDLGMVRWDAEEEAWSIQSGPESGTFSIRLMGGQRPDEARLASARELLRNPRPFLAGIRSLLDAAPAEPEDAAEIRGLQVESVSFPWPDRPRDAMVYFKETERRLWRCNLIDGVPRDLGFDD